MLKQEDKNPKKPSLKRKKKAGNEMACENENRSPNSSLGGLKRAIRRRNRVKAKKTGQ